MSGRLLVAGVGASAGGVEALRALFGAARLSEGIAYIVQLHLDPGRDSALTQILAKGSSLPVATATDGAEPLPDQVLVVPPAVEVGIEDGRIRLRPMDGVRGPLRQIDALFATLAQAFGDRAVGIVLSGFGTDGTLGVKAIKEHGGLAVAQGSNGSMPGHPEMPESAIGGGLVDLVLSVEAIPAALATYAASFAELAVLAPDAVRAAAEESRVATARGLICAALRRDTGHDFSGYKLHSFLRRVQRRMQVLRLSDLDAYVERVRSDHEESRALLRDLLISVTAFFRDADAYAALAETVVPRLFEGKGAGDAVRVWVAGCATGEEAYSIAILLREHATTLPAPPRLQVFATDIDDHALEIARIGRYPDATLEEMSPQRLERFFQRQAQGHSVTKDIREICVFSAHSVIRDPPFSRLDLISCRNLLIYLDNATQRDLFPVFHFALRPAGFLFLGSAESATPFTDLFQPLDKSHRLFQRRDHAARPAGLRLLHRPPLGPRLPPRAGQLPGEPRPRSIREIADAAILEHFAPAHVVVNGEGEVIHFSGRTGDFLEAAPGLPTSNLLAIARRGLRLELRTALQEAFQSRRRITRTGLDPDALGLPGRTVVVIDPLVPVDPDQPLFLVVFSQAPPPGPAIAVAARPKGAAEAAVAVAEQELRETRERLQTLLEEYETTVEEMRASNEELVSVNEELQSANEELETAKEEQQSVNEELQTVNQELHGKVEELDRANADMRNLFDATRVAVITLDAALAIRNFTPAVTGLFNLLPTDRGRPFADIAGTLDTGPILGDARQVVGDGRAVERRIGSRDGRAQYLLRVQAYRAADGSSDGVLVALVDVTQMAEAVEARDQQRLLVGELNHRVRNMLQVLIGLTRQTLRELPSPEEFGKALTGRMRAMSKAYELIAREEWGDVTLLDLVQQQLGPHLSRPEQGSVAGPRVILRPAGAVALGLVLHELATNAVKYGALAIPEGRVEVRWSVDAARAHPVVAIEWCEHGGPTVVAPTRRGFGSDLLKTQVERALHGTITVTFAGEGICAEIDIPLTGDVRDGGAG